MQKLKLNMAFSGILLGLLVVLLVATTLAYFSDTRQVTNTITAGNVEIVLSEAQVKPDSTGNLVEDATLPRIVGGSGETEHKYGKIYPAQTIYKDPTVVNSGSEDAWIAFRITLHDGSKDLRKVLGYGRGDRLDIHRFFSGSVFSEGATVGAWKGFEHAHYNEHYAMVQVPNPTADKYEFYVFMLSPLSHGEEVVLFDTMTISDEWGNADMQELAELKIDVEAFGVQTFSLEGCYEAMTTALPEYFNLQ